LDKLRLKKQFPRYHPIGLHQHCISRGLTLQTSKGEARISPVLGKALAEVAGRETGKTYHGPMRHMRPQASDIVARRPGRPLTRCRRNRSKTGKKSIFDNGCSMCISSATDFLFSVPPSSDPEEVGLGRPHQGINCFKRSGHELCFGFPLLRCNIPISAEPLGTHQILVAGRPAEV
jgi:hypothetical protein